VHAGIAKSGKPKTVGILLAADAVNSWKTLAMNAQIAQRPIAPNEALSRKL
jgi:hypothetical protein